MGVILTPQLAYSKHLEKVNAKAKAKIGQIFAMAPVKNVSTKLAQDLFDIYVRPLYDYCSSIWTTNVCKTAKDNMNRVQLKFWKRYLQVPKWAPTDITYLVSGSIPLSEKIFRNPTKALESINLSINLTGHQLHLIRNKPKPEEEYEFQEEMPEKFWEILRSQHSLPINPENRRKFTSKLFDLKHRHLCNRNMHDDFHNCADQLKCKCKVCNVPMDWYHECHPILDHSR